MMGRLTNLTSKVTALPPRLQRQTDAHGHNTADRWRSWYSLKRWAVLRLEIFERDLFTCQMVRCGRIEGNTSLLVADHVEPHRGDPNLFWSKTNLQTLCKPCHDSAKQTAERRRWG